MNDLRSDSFNLSRALNSIDTYLIFLLFLNNLSWMSVHVPNHRSLNKKENRLSRQSNESYIQRHAYEKCNELFLEITSQRIVHAFSHIQV